MNKTIALRIFIFLATIVGCNHGMASVGYHVGFNAVPGASLGRAFEEYGIPGAVKGAAVGAVGFCIWFGVPILLNSLKGKQYKLPSIFQPPPPLNAEESMKVIETAIRKATKKSTGKLTKADFEKVIVMDFQDKGLTSVKGLEKLTQLTNLHLLDNQLTDVKGLVKLTQLRMLSLNNNPALTKAQVDQLQKALPNCKIFSNPTK